jgi:hypothetical protein
MIGALALAGCGASQAPVSGSSAAPAAAATTCEPHLNPTAPLGIPGFRLGDDLQAIEILQQDAEKGTLPGSPLDELPPHITQLTETGARAAWSPDGKRLLYMDDTIGDIIELDLATGATRELTAPFATAGFLRAHYLPNCDLLLCGPRERDPAIEEDGRFRGELWVQQAPFDAPPVALGQSCWEGVAIDARSDEIAWAQSNIDFNRPDVFVQALLGTSEIYIGRVIYQNGVPTLADKHLVIDRHDVGLDAIIEPQDFRTLPDGRRELIFSTYFHRGGEVLGVDLQSGVITGYARSPFYEEAEGIHPSGETILVERDRAIELFPGELDIWRLTLDGSGSFERMTFFTKHCGYGATNPVVSPDGRRFAFQLERKQDGPLGAGFGLLLFDLDLWDAAHPEGGAPDPYRLPPEVLLP